MLSYLMVNHMLTLPFSWDSVANEYKPMGSPKDTLKDDAYAFLLGRQSGMRSVLGLIFRSIITAYKASLIPTLRTMLSSGPRDYEICYAGLWRMPMMSLLQKMGQE